MKRIIIILSVLILIIVGVIIFFTVKDDAPKDESTTNQSSVSAEGGVDAPTYVYESACGYSGYIRDDNLYISCLNADKMYISSVRHLPIYRFDTKEQLDEFVGNYFHRPKGYDSYNEMPFFDDTVSHCDEEFFKENVLFAVYLEASSGSFRYAVDDVLNDGKNFFISVLQTNDPEVYTTDVVSWIITVSAKKEAVQTCTNFDAVLNS